MVKEQTVFANTKLKIPYEVGDTRRAGFFRLLRERGINPYGSGGWNRFNANDDFKRYLVINENGLFVSYYSENGYNHTLYRDYKVITEADLKANKILSAPEAHVDDYKPKVKNKNTRKRGKVTEVKITEKTPLSTGDVAEHTASGAVILLDVVGATSTVKGTLLGYAKKVDNPKTPGKVGQYDLKTLTRFDGKITLSNQKVKKTRTKIKAPKSPW